MSTATKVYPKGKPRSRGKVLKKKEPVEEEDLSDSDSPTFPTFTIPSVVEDVQEHLDNSHKRKKREHKENEIAKTEDKDNKFSEETSSEISTNSPLTWDILGLYFKDQHLRQLVRHQIESYNNFVNYQIQKTINMFNPVKITSEQDYVKELDLYSMEIHIHFENFQLQRPQIHENNGASKLMFPQEARLRNFTYSSMMTLDMNIQYIVRSGKDMDQTH